jgi:glycerol-3-phosphate acyltransferase PlsY
MPGTILGGLIAQGDNINHVQTLIYLNIMSEVPLACGIAAILGHSFSLFLRFTGGKGVATSAGVFLFLLPVPTLIAAVVFGVAVWRSRMVSLGSILAAITLSVAAFLVPEFILPVSMFTRVVVVLVAALVIWKHRANIGRIARGEENKF